MEKIKQDNLAIAISHCRDQDIYPEIFPRDYGIGITFKDDDGKEYTTIYEHDHDTQRVTLSISSFMGSGGIHFYGRLRVGDPLLLSMENGGEKRSWISGYFNRFKPKECQGVDIELIRPVTKEEINADPDRWEYYRKGDSTNAFRSERELISVVTLVFKERFKDRWILRE
jgi:hypothetical protein